MNMTTRPEGRVVFLQMKLCRRKSEKRADRVVRPYKVRRKIGGTGGQGRPPLRLARCPLSFYNHIEMRKGIYKNI